MFTFRNHSLVIVGIILDIPLTSNVIPEKGIRMSVYLSVRKIWYSVHTVRIVLFSPILHIYINKLEISKNSLFLLSL